MADRIRKLEVEAERTAIRVSALEHEVAAIKSQQTTDAIVGDLKVVIDEARRGIIRWCVSAAFLAPLLRALLEKFWS